MIANRRLYCGLAAALMAGCTWFHGGEEEQVSVTERALGAPQTYRLTVALPTLGSFDTVALAGTDRVQHSDRAQVLAPGSTYATVANASAGVCASVLNIFGTTPRVFSRASYTLAISGVT